MLETSCDSVPTHAPVLIDFYCRTLDISSNQLTGSIPSTLSALRSSLQYGTLICWCSRWCKVVMRVCRVLACDQVLLVLHEQPHISGGDVYPAVVHVVLPIFRSVHTGAKRDVGIARLVCFNWRAIVAVQIRLGERSYRSLPKWVDRWVDRLEFAVEPANIDRVMSDVCRCCFRRVLQRCDPESCPVSAPVLPMHRVSYFSRVLDG